jgi:hypothetical protein
MLSKFDIRRLSTEGDTRLYGLLLVGSSRQARIYWRNDMLIYVGSIVREEGTRGLFKGVMSPMVSLTSHNTRTRADLIGRYRFRECLAAGVHHISYSRGSTR